MTIKCLAMSALRPLELESSTLTVDTWCLYQMADSNNIIFLNRIREMVSLVKK